MKAPYLLYLILFCVLVTARLNAQNTSSDSLHFGIWQGFGDPMSKTKFPEIRGRLCNFNWKDIETANNVWQWDQFDSDLTVRAQDSLPIIFMVYTEEDAPDWLYSYGVPKVSEYNDSGEVIAYTPYYADSRYKKFFKRMITTVHQHVETLPDSVRKYIVGVQGCYGSTGDYIGYKGSVDSEYELSSDDFFNLFKEFSLYYYREYFFTNPKIYLLSNPQNNGEDQMNWLIDSCPNSWIKCGSLGKGFELNDELDKSSWLYNLLNYQQNGDYIRSRSELQGDPSDYGWWREYPYRNMFALMTYCIYWGLDWSNQAPNQITDSLFEDAFIFYNKYAGQKNPALATNAFCALKDVLDASDTIRFPPKIFGPPDRSDTTRYKNIAARYAKQGARLEDPLTATLSEGDNLLANGINDVGWNLFPGNYDRYLHQINANVTSIGLWNVNATNDSTSMYGKYARSFSVQNGKNALYFDVDSIFLKDTVWDGNNPVSVEITYLDSGTGGFKLFYDSKKAGTDKPSIVTQCNNSGKWKKASVTLYDAYFGNRGESGSDFYIKATNSQNVIFSIVELTRPDSANPQIGLFATSPLKFDTICTKTSQILSFQLKGYFLNGTPVVISTLNGFQYALSQDGVFTDSLSIAGYGASINTTIYVKFAPQKSGNYFGNIIISGGGFAGTFVQARAVSANSRPVVSATVTNIDCYNNRDGAIALNITGGTGPFGFTWTSDFSNFQGTTQDLSGLQPGNYTVVVSSFAGCTVTASYAITQPAALVATATLDSAILCKNDSTTVTVLASGGVTPYKGTGVFREATGNISFTVTDSNACTATTNKISIANGTLTAPAKPLLIKGSDTLGVCGGGTFSYLIDSVATATSYSWTQPATTTITRKNLNGTGIALFVPSSFVSGTLTVTANNICGSSNGATKPITAAPNTPVGISGPTIVAIGQVGLVYKVISPSPNLSYTWTASGDARIISGQNTWRANITWGTIAGSVNAKAVNNCGASSPASLNVNLLLSALSEDAAINYSPTTFTLLPNPAKNETSVFFINAKNPHHYTIVLADIAGKILQRKQTFISSGNTSEKFLLNDYSAGMYFITITDETGNKKVLKLMKF